MGVTANLDTITSPSQRRRLAGDFLVGRAASHGRWEQRAVHRLHQL